MRTHRDNLLSYRSPAERRRAGFTLLEILTVIIIIGMLLLIGVPSILRMQQVAMRKTSLATINTIEVACNLYWNDFAYYPPSDNTGGLEGRQWLVSALTGQQLDGGGTVMDDRLPGWGFKTSARSKVYGPYADAHKIPRRGLSSTDKRLSFADAFDNEIYYYRFNATNSNYTPGDNTGGPSDINTYTKRKAPDNSLQYFRQDIVLLSKGPDGIWGSKDPVTATVKEYFKDYGAIDDITDFLQER